MVDMYFYRDPEEQERDQEEAGLDERKAITTGAEDEFATSGGDWDAEALLLLLLELLNGRRLVESGLRLLVNLGCCCP
jgi:hypothetical protein